MRLLFSGLLEKKKFRKLRIWNSDTWQSACRKASTYVCALPRASPSMLPMPHLILAKGRVPCAEPLSRKLKARLPINSLILKWGRVMCSMLPWQRGSSLLKKNLPKNIRRHRSPSRKTKRNSAYDKRHVVAERQFLCEFPLVGKVRSGDCPVERNAVMRFVCRKPFNARKVYVALVS